jgi:hypothetical protein
MHACTISHVHAHSMHAACMLVWQQRLLEEPSSTFGFVIRFSGRQFASSCVLSVGCMHWVCVCVFLLCHTFSGVFVCVLLLHFTPCKPPCKLPQAKAPRSAETRAHGAGGCSTPVKHRPPRLCDGMWDFSRRLQPSARQSNTGPHACVMVLWDFSRRLFWESVCFIITFPASVPAPIPCAACVSPSVYQTFVRVCGCVCTHVGGAGVDSAARQLVLCSQACLMLQ